MDNWENMRRTPDADGSVPFLVPTAPAEDGSPSLSTRHTAPASCAGGLPSPVLQPLHGPGLRHLQSIGSFPVRQSYGRVPSILQAGGGPIPWSSRVSSSLASPRSSLGGPMAPTAGVAEEAAAGSRSWWSSLSRAEVGLLLTGYTVLFSRYLVSQQLAGFFTSVRPKQSLVWYVYINDKYINTYVYLCRCLCIN